MQHSNFRSTIKTAVHAVAVVIVFPLVVANWFSRALLDDSCFPALSQLLSLLPGKSGSYLRIAFYRFAIKKCHSNTFLSFLVIFSQSDMEIEEGVYVGPSCNIGSCKIGRNTLLGSGVHIMSGKQQHNYSDPSIPIKDQGGQFQKIEIGEDCWIGNGAMIMANLGDRCIVGAGSVVTGDIPDGSIVAGNPAKIIGNRKG